MRLQCERLNMLLSEKDAALENALDQINAKVSSYCKGGRTG